MLNNEMTNFINGLGFAGRIDELKEEYEKAKRKGQGKYSCTSQNINHRYFQNKLKDIFKDITEFVGIDWNFDMTIYWN